MRKKLEGILIVTAISLVPTLLIWLPFFLRLKSFWNIPLSSEGMGTIVANYDGPLFIVVAKTFYNIEQIKNLFSFPLPAEYYAAHFPLFAGLIRLFSPIFGYPYSMILVTLASSILAIYFFKRFISQYVNKKEVYWITFVFAIFPARWLIVRSVGSSEPLFLACIIASIFYFQKKRYWMAGIWGALAQLTKSPGILLFVGYVIAIIIPSIQIFATRSFGTWIESLKLKKVYPILLIPLALVALFVFYGIIYGDILAYFNSGDNIHLFFPPFQIFNYSADWVGTFWLEEIILIYFIAGLSLAELIKKKYITLASFVGVYMLSIIFVSHRDVLRYALPIIPFLYAAWAPKIVSREFKIVMIALLLPIYLYSLAYISQNVMPISNWAPLL